MIKKKKRFSSVVNKDMSNTTCNYNKTHGVYNRQEIR